MRIPMLPKWAYSDLLPAFHDVESGTAIQQTAKLYAVMKGMVDDYNKFAEEVNITIEKYMCDVNTDQEQFKNEMTKLIHDYIITIDAKIAHQDRKIDEGVQYMKDNLSSSITQIVNEMKEMGELDESILNAIDGIGGRVVALETANTQNTEDIQNLKTENTDLFNRITLLENSKVKMIYNESTESISFENLIGEVQ